MKNYKVPQRNTRYKEELKINERKMTPYFQEKIIWMTADFSSQTTEAERKKQDIF